MFQCNLYMKYSSGRTEFYTHRFRIPIVSTESCGKVKQSV